MLSFLKVKTLCGILSRIVEKPSELLGLANIAVLCIHGPKSYGVICAYVPIGSRLISMFNIVERLDSRCKLASKCLELRPKFKVLRRSNARFAAEAQNKCSGFVLANFQKITT